MTGEYCAEVFVAIGYGYVDTPSRILLLDAYLQVAPLFLLELCKQDVSLRAVEIHNEPDSQFHGILGAHSRLLSPAIERLREKRAQAVASKHPLYLVSHHNTLRKQGLVFAGACAQFMLPCLHPPASTILHRPLSFAYPQNL